MTCQRICRIAEAVQMNASGHKYRKYTDSRRQYPFRKLHPQAHKTPQAHQRADHCADQRERAQRIAHTFICPFCLRHRNCRKHRKCHDHCRNHWIFPPCLCQIQHPAVISAAASAIFAISRLIFPRISRYRTVDGS